MIVKFASALRLAPLLRRFRERLEREEVPLEESVRILSGASELVLLKLRWLLPSASRQESSPEEESEEGVEEMVGATAAPVMEPEQVDFARSLLEARMKAASLMFPRGNAASFQGGRRLEVMDIEPDALRDAMVAMAKRAAGADRTYVVSKWNFVAHMRGLWREIRRLSSRGAVILLSRLLGKTKEEAILSFLAFLELVKRRRLLARQPVLFGDIEVMTARGAPEGEER